MLKRAPFDVDRHNHFIMNSWWGCWMFFLLLISDLKSWWERITTSQCWYYILFCFLVFGIRLIARLRSSVDSQIGHMKTSVVQLVTWILCCLTSRDPIIIKDAYMIVMLMWTWRIAIDICIPIRTYLVFSFSSSSSSSSIHCCREYNSVTVAWDHRKSETICMRVLSHQKRMTSMSVCEWTNKWKTTKKYKRVVVLLG